MTKRVPLERLRDISKWRTSKLGDPTRHDELRDTVEWPIEAETWSPLRRA